MMELLFLIAWSGLFLLGAGIVWRRVVPRRRTGALIVLNLGFLAGIFYFYPVILELFGGP